MPYRVHTVLTDNSLPRTRSGGIQFTPRKQDIYDGWPLFDRVGEEHGIEHRPTKVNHPLGRRPPAAAMQTDRARRARWTNGQVERMNRTIKAASRRDAAVKRCHYDSHDQLSAHLQLFVDAYARRLKTLRGLTPYEFVCQVWTKEPDRFRLDPSHLIPGPYT